MSDFILHRNTRIIYNGSSSTSIKKAIAIFKRDLKTCLIETDVMEQENRLILTYNEDGLEDDQYRYVVKDDNILIQAKNERGIIYALLHISEVYLGINRFWFWNDQEIEPTLSVSIPQIDYTSPKPRVRYRGWFVNDEVLLSHWKFGETEEASYQSNEEKWERICETLLRCQGNMLIPGTDLIDSSAREIATKMGLIITHHHAEPLGAQMFSRIYPDKEASFIRHKELFIDLWRQAIEEQKDQEIIWNIGFRGQGDRPFWADDPSFTTDEEKGKLISEIIQLQYDLLKEYHSNPVCCVNLYGEVAELYRDQHITLPAGVIKVWADSGYGKMVSRRQGNHNPRIESKPSNQLSGPHGIYYHVTFYDLQASNHLTPFPNTTRFIQNELQEAFKSDMDEFLIVNSGNIRPHQFYLAWLSELWMDDQLDVETFEEEYFVANYGDRHAEIKELFQLYQQAIVPYGDHSDERAGEQLYYYAIRYISHAWLSGQDNGSDRLTWLTGKKTLAEQVNDIHKLIQPYVHLWDNLYEKVSKHWETSDAISKRIFNQLYIPIAIHRNGIKALDYLCHSFAYQEEEKTEMSFLEVGHAYEVIKKLVNEMAITTDSKWDTFYDNDCLTNISLALEILDTVRKYLRLIGDGPNFYKWEKQYLTEKEESLVMLLTNKTKQLSTDDLYQQLLSRMENI